MDCACTAPGLCPIFNRRMVGRSYQICRGQSGLTPQQEEAYRQYWLDKAGKPSNPPRSYNCTHRGAELESIQCPSCGGKVMVKTFACEIHGRCSLQKNVGENIKICKGCTEISPPML